MHAARSFASSCHSTQSPVSIPQEIPNSMSGSRLCWTPNPRSGPLPNISRGAVFTESTLRTWSLLHLFLRGASNLACKDSYLGLPVSGAPPTEQTWSFFCLKIQSSMEGRLFDSILVQQDNFLRCFCRSRGEVSPITTTQKRELSPYSRRTF